MTAAPLRTEACAVCGAPLEYLVTAAELTCSVCGRTQPGHVRCAAGHYVCERCHGASFMDALGGLARDGARDLAHRPRRAAHGPPRPAHARLRARPHRRRRADDRVARPTRSWASPTPTWHEALPAHRTPGDQRVLRPLGRLRGGAGAGRLLQRAGGRAVRPGPADAGGHGAGEPPRRRDGGRGRARLLQGVRTGLPGRDAGLPARAPGHRPPAAFVRRLRRHGPAPPRLSRTRLCVPPGEPHPGGALHDPTRARRPNHHFDLRASHLRPVLLPCLRRRGAGRAHARSWSRSGRRWPPAARRERRTASRSGGNTASRKRRSKRRCTWR